MPFVILHLIFNCDSIYSTFSSCLRQWHSHHNYSHFTISIFDHGCFDHQRSYHNVRSMEALCTTFNIMYIYSCIRITICTVKYNYVNIIFYITVCLIIPFHYYHWSNIMCAIIGSWNVICNEESWYMPTGYVVLITLAYDIYFCEYIVSTLQHIL